MIKENKNVEKTLSQALTKKLGIIEIKRQTEQKEKARLEKLEKESMPMPQRKRRASIATIRLEKEPRKSSTPLMNNSLLAIEEKLPSRRNSLVDQERKLHEAYQFVLGEHYKKVNTRRKSLHSVIDSDFTKHLQSLSLPYQPRQRHASSGLPSIKQEGKCE